MCVNASARVSDAKTTGAEAHSKELTFEPKAVNSGEYGFATGTAGSTTLVYQCLAPALAFAPSQTKLEITGGTSNAWAPSSWFLKHAFLPTVSRMGFEGSIEVERHGWYPKGGGVLKASVKPVKGLRAVDLRERGKLKIIRGFSVASNLPMHIAERQKAQALKDLTAAGLEGAEIELVNAPSIGIGTELFLCAEYENSVAGFSSLGERGKPAEKVAGEAAKALVEFHDSGAAIDAHLNDQILLYCAIARGESNFTTSKVTTHLLTNAWTIRQFLPEAEIEIDGREGEAGTVRVNGAGYENKLLKPLRH